nr:PDDEXK nuclease domain-containing protein [Methanobrevibacter arboriphilus]
MMISNNKISSKLKEVYPKSASYFKDDYVFEFLDLEDHSENQLQKALIKNLKKFILELGRDFLFVGKEYRIQVGNNDFYIDLLFFNRELQCLVAFELKTDKFKPEHLGQLNFYLEALDRDVKKEQENPSIGILLCRDKDDTVVEYAISRSLSPSMVSQYRTKLPDKKLLKEKLNQIL